MEQGSPEWEAARLGKVSASRISQVVAGGKGVTRRNYMADLIAEQLSGEKAETFNGYKLERGKEVEAEARAAYCFYMDATVTETGFVEHPTIKMCGASPDGLVGDDGLIEVKCPDTSTHIETRLGKTIAKAYRDQMQFQMAVTGRKWCDFVSFDPRIGEKLALFVKRIERDSEHIAFLDKAVVEFQAEMATKIEALKNG